MEQVIAFSDVMADAGAEPWGNAVTFAVEAPRCYVIRTTPGRSSTFVSLCLGSTAPTAGTVSVLGVSPSELSRSDRARWRTKVGTVLQPEGLLTTLTLRNNIVVPLVFASHFTMPDAQLRAQEVLEATHLLPWADRRPTDLPLDVRQRAAVARALASLPALLLLEDPLSSLASADATDLFEICRQWVPTMIVATHRRNTALYEMADDVMLWDASGFRRGGGGTGGHSSWGFTTMGSETGAETGGAPT